MSYMRPFFALMPRARTALSPRILHSTLLELIVLAGLFLILQIAYGHWLLGYFSKTDLA